MKRNLVFPLAFLLLLTTSCRTGRNRSQLYPDAPSMTQTEQSCGNAWKLPITKIKGEIKRKYYSSPPWTEKRGLHLEVADNSSGKRIVIHVFPEQCIKNRPEKFNLEVGQVISVTGSEFFTNSGTQLNICAARINTLDTWLRDKNDGTVNKSLCSDKTECREICKDKCRSARKPEKCFDRCMNKCE